jgi:hypothetical protein
MATPTDQQTRAAQNELVFRAVNEQIVKMTERFRAQLSDIDIVCECSDANCVSTIRLNADEFTRIERVTGTFFVLSGHEQPEVEEVVARNGQYVVVRKPERALEHARLDGR